ncbi:MAG TPA: acyltransferase [Aliidongia sp.]|nr:acyltransferase [Aliidongia sp.]
MQPYTELSAGVIGTATPEGGTIVGIRAERNIGLDLVRTVAILLVMLGHLMPVFQAPPPWPDIATYISDLGVELFFSLSGFLIGQILLDTPPGATRRFWIRRWLRTLPAYYFYYALFALVQPPAKISTLFFVQQFFPPPTGFFVVAWSLAMEEWFYLLFPIICLGLGAFVWPNQKRHVIVLRSALAVITACCAIRFGALHFLLHWPHVLGELSFRAHPIVRLDCCAYGVVLAALVRMDPVRLQALVARWRPIRGILCCIIPFALLGVVFIVLVTGNHEVERRIFFPLWAASYYTFDYPVKDLTATILVMIIYFTEFSFSSGVRYCIQKCGMISYSIYLVHTLVNLTWTTVFVSLFGMSGGVAVYLMVVIFCAMLSYRLIERPFLAVRERFFPGLPSRSSPRHSERKLDAIPAK